VSAVLRSLHVGAACAGALLNELKTAVSFAAVETPALRPSEAIGN
jgi:hypothetical protein